MTESADWDRWRGSWQTQEPTSHELDDATARFHRATQREAVIRVIEWAIVVLAVVFPVVAIRHAANLLEATLGMGAAIIVLGVAAFRAWHGRAERAALGASTREFDDAVRSLRGAELRFVRYLWFVLGVEGVFAAVWWYGGLEVHHNPLGPIAIAMLWVPLLLVAMALAWSVRLRADALRELASLAGRETAVPTSDG